MNTDVRHDCRFCSHSNDSHDPLIGCLYPNCMCGNKSPANFPGKPSVRPATPRHSRTYNGSRKAAQRRFWRATWRVLRAFLVTGAAAVLAGLLLAGAFLVAVLYLIAQGR